MTEKEKFRMLLAWLEDVQERTLAEHLCDEVPIITPDDIELIFEEVIAAVRAVASNQPIVSK